MAAPGRSIDDRGPLPRAVAPLRIGVDATCWANHRGYGRYTRELVSEMAALAPHHRFICFLDERAAARFDVQRPNVHRVVVPQRRSPTVAAAADGYRAPIDMLRFTRAVGRERPDVFFSPSVYTYFPLPPSLPAVVTIHDAIAERYPHLTLPTRRARLMWRCKVGLALWQARLVLTVSDFAAGDLASVLRVPRERIRVSLEAPAAIYRPSDSEAEIAAAAHRVGLPPDTQWFIYVGGFNPHKNVDRIVRAHGLIAGGSRRNPPHLLLVGATSGDVFHGDAATIRQAIAEVGTTSLVHWPGFVADDDLRHLYSGAVGALLPSACEGFGLPAIEAAACATPVIATTESPLPQLLDGGGFFVRPGDDEALCHAMHVLLNNRPERDAMGRRARQRALELTWPGAARAALNAIEEAAP